MIDSELIDGGAADTPSPTSAADATTWESAMAALRKRFSKASDGILFCVFKLQQNPELTIRDFRDEAMLHGIRIGGRAIHSAKVLLGMEQPSIRRSPTKNANGATDRTNGSANGDSHSRFSSSVSADSGMEKMDQDVETSLISAVQQIQNAATADARRLREAMRRAVDVLQRALDGRDFD